MRNVACLDACLAGIQFIHGAASPDAGTPLCLGDFRIIREIGRGGMGAVYEAEQISLKRKVAVKVMRVGAVSDEEAMERFQREAETVAGLHHTNIVPIFAVASEKNVDYYAMQFIQGRSLDAVLRDAHAPLDPDEIADWGLQSAPNSSRVNSADSVSTTAAGNLPQGFSIARTSSSLQVIGELWPISVHRTAIPILPLMESPRQGAH